uniref:Uncharacterized protein n=1 Tax=Bicosoecida sp. CB-2014 TaxID=1486930 RepID=A0A7S1CCP7_9STRA|mmetsp:Transcript_22/g.82  ORF Transcript_22/g.82 Transcript_22/m.82 type:complete len:101 (+) Transcript_22:1216-1518(+)
MRRAPRGDQLECQVALALVLVSRHAVAHCELPKSVEWSRLKPIQCPPSHFRTRRRQLRVDVARRRRRSGGRKTCYGCSTGADRESARQLEACAGKMDGVE